jgi:hypothetical protein
MRDETHCEHGTYVGYPGGPDYMCGWCEDGISLREMREIRTAQEYNRMRNEATVMNSLYDALRDPQHKITEYDREKCWQHMLENYTYR